MFSIYFLPTTPSENSPLPGLINRITANYTCTPLQRWVLEHRLFRDAPNQAIASSAVDEKPKPGPRYLQMLALSHYPGHSFIAVTRTQAASQTRAGTPASSHISADGSGESATLISIPSGPQSDDFLHLVGSKMGPIWMQRPTLSVSNGLSYRMGEYRVRLGEVRQGAGSGAQLKGIAVELEWTGAEEGEWEIGEAAIRAFWDTVGLKKGRGVVQIAGWEKGMGTVRQWIEVLRLKG